MIKLNHGSLLYTTKFVSPLILLSRLYLIYFSQFLYLPLHYIYTFSPYTSLYLSFIVCDCIYLLANKKIIEEK